VNYRVKPVTVNGEKVWHLQAQNSKGEAWKWLSVVGFPAYFKNRRKAIHVRLMCQYPEDFKKGIT